MNSVEPRRAAPSPGPSPDHGPCKSVPAKESTGGVDNPGTDPQATDPSSRSPRHRLIDDQ